jgi:hypothetical protein
MPELAEIKQKLNQKLVFKCVVFGSKFLQKLGIFPK